MNTTPYMSSDEAAVAEVHGLTGELLDVYLFCVDCWFEYAYAGYTVLDAIGNAQKEDKLDDQQKAKVIEALKDLHVRVYHRPVPPEAVPSDACAEDLEEVWTLSVYKNPEHHMSAGDGPMLYSRQEAERLALELDAEAMEPGRWQVLHLHEFLFKP